jgi:hypothetical protein
VLQQFEKAKQQNRDDKKLNEVELRKLFLSLANLINETLEPLCNGSICFPDSEKITDRENDKKLQNFVFDNNFKEKLSKQIENLKIYFRQNGGYVPLGRVTLNKHTAQQKPNKVDNDINKLIEKIKLQKFIKEYTNDKQLNDFIKTTKNKSEKIKDNELSLIEKIQLFKYKTIPVGVRHELSEYLFKICKIDKEQIKKLLQEIGKPQSPAKDYKDLQNKEEFDLHKYPLKVAFDYAWESLAKNEYHTDIEFPKEKCQEFLREVFNINIGNNKDFKLYSALLFIRENLATLDHSKPNNIDIYIKNVETTFKKIGLEKHTKTINTIINWHKKLSNIQQLDYDKAKQTIGQLRGGLKNTIKCFKDLTEYFKVLAVEFGKKFAELRDKFNEEYEINKISHYGIIVEDTNADRYFLLTELSESREEVENLFTNENKGFKTCTVKSLTSKALWKLLHNNKGISEDFHTKNWNCPKKRENLSHEENLQYIIECLKESAMAKVQNWAEFGWNFDKCKTYEDVEKEVDRKGYKLQESGRISKETIESLIKDKNCLLLPIVNQDIARKDREAKNQFTKDWEKIFATNNGYRLHPEFKISYRHPTPNYPKPEEKRYSRFQMIAYLMCEYIPKNNTYTSRKEQIKFFNDKEKQKDSVEKFNNMIETKNDYFIFGIDRGIRQLATLCVLNKNGQIQGGFEIYTREFDYVCKQWKHTLLEKRNILDLSNLRVETTIDGKKVLVDLSEVAVKIKDEHGKYIKDEEGKYKTDKNNQQKIKLKQLAYIRKLQYKMQTEQERVLSFIKKYKTDQDIEQNIKELITPYKEGKNYTDLPIEKIKDMFIQFTELTSKNDDKSEKELREFCELDAADDLKTGVVANMIGVIVYLLEKYNYNIYIALEDLTRAFYEQKDGLSDVILSNTNKDKTVDFKDQENLVLAGLGTYQYFEMQLLKKLFRIQQNNGNILHLVPTFRSVDNYEKIVRQDSKTVGNKYVNYPFGIVQFVDPKYTSEKCPKCGKTNTTRKENILTCKECAFKTPCNQAGEQNIHYIQNADDNGAYHIALKVLENLEKPQKRV